MRKRALALSVVACGVLAAGGWFGYETYADQRAVAELRPHVKLASLHVASILEIEGGKSNITYAEFFKKMDASVDELDKIALQVKNLATPRNRVPSDGALEFIANGQSIIRDLSSRSRNALRAEGAREVADEAQRDSTSANEYTRSHAKERALDAVRKAIEALSAARDMEVGLLPKLAHLEKQSAWTGRTFGEDVVISPKTLEAVVSRYKDDGKGDGDTKPVGNPR